MQVYDGISRLHKIYLINIILKDTKEGERERERERDLVYHNIHVHVHMVFYIFVVHAFVVCMYVYV
jgi:hypothetical protein